MCTTVLIIFSLNLHTNIFVQMLTVGGEGVCLHCDIVAVNCGFQLYHEPR